MMVLQKFNAVAVMRPKKEPEGIVVTITASFVIWAKTEKQAMRNARHLALAKFHKEYNMISCCCTLEYPFNIEGPLPFGKPV